MIHKYICLLFLMMVGNVACSNQEYASGNAPAIASPPTSKPALPTTVCRVNIPHKVVALTFDDGPHARLTPKVLDTLQQHQIKATFFVQGYRVQDNPQLIKRMVQEGHEIGNHTWNHANLRRSSESCMTDQLQRTNQAIEQAAGITPVIMHPPGGATNTSVAKQARHQFGFTTILWDVDPKDWRRPGIQTVIDRVVQNTRPGSIILLHDIHEPTVASVDAIIRSLKERGFEFVTVSDLLQRGFCNTSEQVQAVPQPVSRVE